MRKHDCPHAEDLDPRDCELCTEWVREIAEDEFWYWTGGCIEVEPPPVRRRAARVALVNRILAVPPATRRALAPAFAACAAAKGGAR